jgi:tetratricopeptide (TPR) repeat protein
MNSKILKITLILSFLFGMNIVTAQDKYGSEPDKCKMNLSLFHESVKAKNFSEAMEPWEWCYANCSKASKHIYTDGIKIGLNKYKTASNDVEKSKAVTFVNDVYTKRVEHFPSNLGKVYNDWAKFLIKTGASDEEVFEKLELAFKADPSGMSAKNIFRFFQKVTDNNKDTNVQKIFDTYDDVLDAVNKKIDKFTRENDAINTKVAAGTSLSSKESRRVKSKFYTINLKGLGMIEGGLNSIVDDLMTCDRLIPLYHKDFESNKDNVTWLKRAARKMYKKECTSDALYPKIVERWGEIDPSPEVFKFLANIFRQRGDFAKAAEYEKKYFNSVTDPYEKAKLLLGKAEDYRRSGRKGLARKTAYEALKLQPSLGKAYLLIARMYARSANSCGTKELDKRMVYVAAAGKVNQAMKADPSLSVRGRKYLKSYRANFPSRTLIFNLGLKSGSPHKVGCWIGETVRIP